MVLTRSLRARRRRAARARDWRFRAGHPRRRPARHERLRSVPADSCARRVAGDLRDGARGGGRPHRRSRAGCGRLRREAFLAARARRTRAHGAAARAAPTAAAGQPAADAPAPGAFSVDEERRRISFCGQRARPHALRVRRAQDADRAPGPRVLARRVAESRAGATRRTASIARSMRTSRRCARSSRWSRRISIRSARIAVSGYALADDLRLP